MHPTATVTVCAAITADGKLDAAGATPRDFGPLPPSDVWFASSADENAPEDLRRLFEENRVGEIRLLVRPKIDGRRDSPTLSGRPGEFFPAAVRCRLLETEPRGGECLLRYRVLRARAKR